MVVLLKRSRLHHPNPTDMGKTSPKDHRKHPMPFYPWLAVQ